MALLPSSSPAINRVLKNFRGANREAAGRYVGELANRQKAGRILSPDEVAGDYDAGRLLFTTLGGHLHALSHDDLRTFRENVRILGKRFKGGITAKGVIDLSLKEDRERANKQIRTAVPVQYAGNRVHFMTNAGPDSEVVRHHVHIELVNLSAAVSAPSKAADVAKEVVAGPLRFDCDCGRHTYWYRYIATVGRYNSGRAETGFPKIRNPNLRGVACKHVLRVMQQLNMPLIKKFVEKMITDSRANLAQKPRVLSKREAEEIAKQQAAQGRWKRTVIETSVEKRQRLAQARAIKAVNDRQRSRPPVAANPRSVASAKKQFEQHARKLMTMGVITQAQLSVMLGKLEG